MGKIKKRHSLKWSFVKYIPLCLLMSWIGVYTIGIKTNDLQDWYKERHPEIQLWPSMENIKFFTMSREFSCISLPMSAEDRFLP